MIVTELPGSLVTLRPLDQTHFNDYLTMFSHTVRQMLHVPDLSNELVYLQDRFEQQQQGKTCFFCIFDNIRTTLIGALEIRDQAQHAGQLYCWINERYWGGGRCQEALALAAQAYFQLTQQQFFTAHVDVTNVRSYHALCKSGFAQAGFYNGPYGRQYQLIYRNKV